MVVLPNFNIYFSSKKKMFSQSGNIVEYVELREIIVCVCEQHIKNHMRPSRESTDKIKSNHHHHHSSAFATLSKLEFSTIWLKTSEFEIYLKVSATFLNLYEYLVRFHVFNFSFCCRFSCYEVVCGGLFYFHSRQ